MKRYFHNELDELSNKLILLGEKANEAARMAVDGFLESDIEKAQAALQLDDDIDALEQEISHACVRYITLRSPVSSDVRLMLVAIKASHDFERAGDEAHSIAKKVKNILSRDGRIEEAVAIAEMSQLACAMMQDAITCFVQEDLETAQAIIERDSAVDRLNRANFKTLSSDTPHTQITDRTRIETILISKSIERIADHAKNLAYEVIYLLTGE